MPLCTIGIQVVVEGKFQSVNLNALCSMCLALHTLTQTGRYARQSFLNNSEGKHLKEVRGRWKAIKQGTLET